MKISRIINNNVVCVLDESKRERVMMGNGIAFKKRVGDELDISKIEKTFTPESKDLTERLKVLLSEIPVECMQVSEEIIRFATQQLNRELSETLYVTLTDHIFHAIERKRQGIEIKNGLLWETRRLYKEHFNIGKAALGIIQEKLDVTLADDEAAMIAFHLINGELGEEIPRMMDITKLMNEILNLIKYYFQREFDEYSLEYDRFMTHLKFFSQRLFNETPMKDEDDTLFNMVTAKYPNAAQCVVKIQNFVKEKYKYDLTTQEMMYLTIHIERLLQNC